MGYRLKITQTKTQQVTQNQSHPYQVKRVVQKYLLHTPVGGTHGFKHTDHGGALQYHDQQGRYHIDDRNNDHQHQHYHRIGIQQLQPFKYGWISLNTV